MAGLCDDTQERTCREEVGEENIEWTCSQCEKKKAADISPYTRKMLWIRRLRAGGYPFRPCDLTLEEWEDLARVEDMMQARERSRQAETMAAMLRQLIGR